MFIQGYIMNKETIHTPVENAEPIIRWYKRAQIDYVEHYIRMYIAYNAWYREVTNTTNDRQAISQLKKRVVIWDDYANGKTLKQLRFYMEKLTDLTQKEPLVRTVNWSGSINSTTDYRSLIEYWYQVRCLLVHGSYIHPKYVWLAYETLDIFVSEIIHRMQSLIDTQISQNLLVTPNGRKGASENDKFEKLRQQLYRKYISSPNVWSVDMNRV